MRRSQADVRISLVCKVIFDSCHVSLVSLENITNMNAYAEEVDTAFSGPGQGVKVKDLCHLYVMFHFLTIGVYTIFFHSCISLYNASYARAISKAYFSSLALVFSTFPEQISSFKAI